MGEGDSDEPPDIFGEENQRNKEAQIAEKFKLEELRELFISSEGLILGTEGLFVRPNTAHIVSKLGRIDTCETD